MLLRMPHNFIVIELRHEPFLLLLSLSDNINNIWLFRLIVVHHYFVIGMANGGLTHSSFHRSHHVVVSSEFPY